MVELGYTKKPYPKIILDNSDRDDDLLCSTGYFDPNADAIRLFIKKRLFKDVMRTAAHEFTHWKQQLDGDIARSGYKSDKISEDENLVKLEAEAYLKGNFGLRKYTEHLQKEGRK
jgi:antirestriction protein ArdC